MTDRVFVNYRTALKNITAFGFDLDDTIVIYKPKAFKLRFDLVSKILAERDPRFNFLLEAGYNPSFMIRGLVIDKKQGTILKLNLRKQVDIAMHGKTKLSLEKRDSIYPSPISLRESYNGQARYKVLDSFNYIVDAYIYASIIEQYKDFYSLHEHDRNFYLFNELYKAVESIHNPETRLFLNELMKNFEDYIEASGNGDGYCTKIKSLLQKIRKSGKKVFLITNSGEQYTIHVLKFLFGENYKDFFDEIVVDSMKPRFFSSEDSFSEGTSSFVKKGGSFLELLKLYQGILPNSFIYIGDHFKGDVLSGNRKRGILPAAIVPEIFDDIKTEKERVNINSRIFELGNRIDALKLELSQSSGSDMARIFTEAIEARKIEIKKLKEKRFKMSNQFWGSPFLCGTDSTLFANQIKTFTNFYIADLLALSDLDLDKKLVPLHIERMPHHQNV